ncbi:hypothetical protein BJ138DRAFT_888184 [Hygrophoropsis aurantiaca]|uniref:Uncharacterized protein n=1 Tax=Hygrophoropsis aurantiaca TaxID=72124 RepID=A0ACB7ZV47_9AGAM|nr:hypothetical protein BJ138DRAFT_888184 [Hygrophoropsis aurantiaca]
MRAALRASAITVAILCTLSSVARTSAKCVYSNPFALSLAIYEFEDCETHAADDHHLYQLEKHPLNEKWDERGCQCLDFDDYLKRGARSIVFTPGRHGGMMHLLHDEQCALPYEDEYDVITYKRYIDNSFFSWFYKSARVCRGNGGPDGDGEPAPEHDHDGVVKELKHAAEHKVVKDGVKKIAAQVKKKGWGDALEEGASAVEGFTLEDAADAGLLLLLA